MRQLFKLLAPYGLLLAFKKWRQAKGVPFFMGLEKLDQQVIKAINPNQGGFFVELGANDGISQSNTYKLQYSYGWTGILIEPNPSKCLLSVMNRRFGSKPPVVACAACVPFDYAERYVELIEADLMSIAIGLDIAPNAAASHAKEGLQLRKEKTAEFRYASPARTLTSILNEHNAPRSFDFLSLDVEGNEASVLSGLDFGIYRPQWILVEIRDEDYCTRKILLQNSYRLVSEFNRRPSLADYLFQSAT